MGLKLVDELLKYFVTIIVTIPSFFEERKKTKFGSLYNSIFILHSFQMKALIFLPTCKNNEKSRIKKKFDLVIKFKTVKIPKKFHSRFIELLQRISGEARLWQGTFCHPFTQKRR